MEKAYLNQKLGFGQYCNKKISEFNSQETEYLLWVLKTVRLPQNLWETIIEFLKTKIIIQSKSCIGNLSDCSLEEIEMMKSTPDFKLDLSLFLKFRKEPNVKYHCKNCNSDIYGKARKGVLNEVILCENCNTELDIHYMNLRLYFGWYKGWRIVDFNTSEDIEYLKWILENFEDLPYNYKVGFKEKTAVSNID